MLIDLVCDVVVCVNPEPAKDYVEVPVGVCTSLASGTRVCELCGGTGCVEVWYCVGTVIRGLYGMRACLLVARA